jgi:hypothetical protein
MKKTLDVILIVAVILLGVFTVRQYTKQLDKNELTTEQLADIDAAYAEEKRMDDIEGRQP